MLSEIGDYCTGYSYWTFGDVFEEMGVPFTPFHGGFGLVANYGIPKPTYWTFLFYKSLKGQCVYRDENLVIVKKENGTLAGIAWNVTRETSREKMEFNIQLPLQDGHYSLLKKTVDENVCNPLKVWHDIGEPQSLDKAQAELLRDAAKPLITTERLHVAEGRADASIEVLKNGVVYFEIGRVEGESDRGYEFLLD